MTVQELRKALEQFGDWPVVYEQSWGGISQVNSVYREKGRVVISEDERDERETNP